MAHVISDECIACGACMATSTEQPVLIVVHVLTLAR
jgi:NAD-dependent dihydropyrimidine dehydrogenase PreA subunit